MGIAALSIALNQSQIKQQVGHDCCYCVEKRKHE
jgi:hypothetical protein